jgi:hypothetical protein
MTEESSLTAPEDRNRVSPWKPQQHEPPLSNSHLEIAFRDLNKITNYPKIDRVYIDPPIHSQSIGLISFTPAKGATPNEKGIFGFAKLRGNYPSTEEANLRAEYIIKNVDSYHNIYHTHVGRPFPLTTSSEFSFEVNEIDLKKEITQSVSSHIKDKKEDEQKIAAEIKQREEQLLDESKKEDVDPYENYITLQVKKAQLSWTYLEHTKKLEEVKGIIIKTREELKTLDLEHPTFKESYYKKYMDARKEAGIKETDEAGYSNFIKFMIEEADLGF